MSVDIGATEEYLGPESSKFREGHTKVSDVEKIYLTGQYKQKYKSLTEFYNSTPCKKLYPVLEWSGAQTPGGRKIRSAYPNVRLRSATLRSNNVYNNNHHSPITTPSRINVKATTVKSTVS